MDKHDALDVALAHEAAQIDIGEAERNPELVGEAPLCNLRISGNRFKRPQVPLVFDVHAVARRSGAGLLISLENTRGFHGDRDR